MGCIDRVDWSGLVRTEDRLWTWHHEHPEGEWLEDVALGKDFSH